MRNPYTPPAQDEVAQQFLMRIADLLSDDPLLIAVLGENFKVAADYNSKKKFERLPKNQYKMHFQFNTEAMVILENFNLIK